VYSVSVKVHCWPAVALEMGKDIIESRNNIIKNQNINKIYSLTNFVMKYSCIFA